MTKLTEDYFVLADAYLIRHLACYNPNNANGFGNGAVSYTSANSYKPECGACHDPCPKEVIERYNFIFPNMTPYCYE